MILKVSNIKVPIDEDSSSLEPYISKKLNVKKEDISSYSIVKRAIDARKAEVYFVYTVEVEIARTDVEGIIRRAREPKPTIVQPKAPVNYERGHNPLKKRPLVIGAGPAGLFAALLLAEYGYKPLVLERGFDVDTRTKDIERFWSTAQLNLDSNVQFGEGGAGTFSDGKLTTRINDPRINKVFHELVESGSPEEILYVHKPHVGTDKLRVVVKNIRNKIISLGGEVRFGTKVTKLLMEKQRVVGIEVNGETEILSDVVILAVGNSARDTYETLAAQGVEIAAKPFAIGVRVEHPQELIDKNQYGQSAGHPKLGAADYQLVYKDKERERTAYSFCMCPGGVVVGAASETEQVVTNGMSYFARDTGIANSALVVSVNPEDFDGASNPLGGISFQRKYEKAAFKAGGGNYSAPVQRIDDFLDNRPTSEMRKKGDLYQLEPSYKPGVKPADLGDCLPEFVIKTLQTAMMDFDRKIKGYNLPEGILTGVETRTSAPVRIGRNDDYISISHEGLYPTGEGAGYAGGIVSAAVDGIRVAEAIIKRYRKEY